MAVAAAAVPMAAAVVATAERGGNQRTAFGLRQMAKALALDTVGAPTFGHVHSQCRCHNTCLRALRATASPLLDPRVICVLSCVYYKKSMSCVCVK